nr:protein brambleberry-like [Pelodiscus sinensis]|eukprot:XP_006131757.1 protein brambleberry-like [Pelodiscus sinensis]
MALLNLILLGCSNQTLAECTADMDPDTWNAYHIVSNRARAVCYATRQMQFKHRAEHTVNTLVSAAVSQLEAMKLLKDGQEELKELTAESLHKVVSSQQELLLQQEKLQDSQLQVESSIHSNLEQLTQEKALIASGQQQVAQLIEGITKRMENVSRHLDDQDLELQRGHRAILTDLAQMQRRTQEAYSKIGTVTAAGPAGCPRLAAWWLLGEGDIGLLREELSALEELSCLQGE